MPALLPPLTATGFKEWALVCAALASGRQSIILRKGGIAEGRDGFHFKHETFFLFSTQYHQQAEMIRPGEAETLRPAPVAPAGTVEIREFFAVESAGWIDDWAVLERLEPFHIWREEVVRDRFHYDGQRGIQCAIGRIYRLETPWTFADRPGFGGCRSWLQLPEPPTDASLAPALDDDEHAARVKAIRAAISGL